MLSPRPDTSTESTAARLVERASDDAGLRAGPFRCVALLGTGGSARVFEAVDARDAAAPACAIKVLAANADDVIARVRFEREREVQSQLQHRHIVPVFASGVLPDDRPWMAMELVRGPMLKTYLGTAPPRLAERLALFSQIAQAIEAAHDAGWVHRDLKPSNVLIDAAGQARVIDFGLAKRADRPSVGVVRTFERFHGVTLTPAYAAPEQLRHASASQRGIDVHALGVLLYEMVTGVQPFEQAARAGMPIASAVCDWVPPRPSSIAPTLWGSDIIDAAMDELVLHALAKLAADRPASVADLAADVARWCRRQDPQATQWPVSGQGLRRWWRSWTQRRADRPQNGG